MKNHHIRPNFSSLSFKPKWATPLISVLLTTSLIMMVTGCQSGSRSAHRAASIPVPPAADAATFTEQERLRGSITPERSWWNVLHYDLKLRVYPETKRIEGSNTIRFMTRETGRRMQIDLQEPLEITKVLYREREVPFERDGNVYWIQFGWTLGAGVRDEIEVFYAGTPVESERPPWSGGFTWTQDDQGHPFIATTCQGVGASIWWPNKDHGYDEPNQGMDITVTVPEALTAVSNGRLVKKDYDPTRKLNVFHWKVTAPINNYCVNVNIGNYVTIDGTYEGEAGPLDTQYWVLAHNEEKARKHFEEAPRTLEAFEHWFGPYPFYEDSYKLVEVPYLGMEHQSSVTYGNGYKNGYRGRDLSDTGVGLLFDYIVIHETAHEWFGNNISMQDAADMWIHESFADYAENLFVEYHFGEEKAQDYVIGCRKLIKNDRPIIGTYGVNKTGSGDMYPKGANILHTLRHAIGHTEMWRSILRELNEEFHHKTVTTEEVEALIEARVGYELGPFFDQYLRTVEIPVVKYRIEGPEAQLWFENVVEGFRLPVVVWVNGEAQRMELSQAESTYDAGQAIESLELDRNFYMRWEAESVAAEVSTAAKQ